MKLDEAFLSPYKPKMDKINKRFRVTTSFKIGGHQYWMRTNVNAIDTDQAKRLAQQLIKFDMDRIHSVTFGSVKTFVELINQKKK